MRTHEIIDREKHQKLYVQLYSLLKRKIEKNEWPVGTQIPTEDELCKNYEVSKATVKLAVLELAREGYVTRKQGKGTFVHKRVIPEWRSTYKSFKEMMLDAGLDFTTQVLVRTVIMPADGIDLKLNVPIDQHVIYIKRLRSVDGSPVLLQEAYIPHQVCPALLEADIANDSLFDILERKCSLKMTKVKEYVDVEKLTDEDCRLLQLEANASALMMEQQFFSKETPLMYMRTIKRLDRFKFFFELERNTDITGE
jgi:DNA-binding GntR family transcriptional regulator